MMKGAIFDMDGLLFGTERFFWESYQETTEKFGQAYDPAFPTALGGCRWSEIPAVVRSFYPGVDAEAFRDACIERVLEKVEQRGLEEKPGVRNILPFLRKRNFKIAIASGSGLEIVQHHLRFAGIENYFDVIVSSTEVSNGKPAPDVFLLAARRLGLVPQECYVFEDSLNGVRAGMAAGCVTVMVPDMVQPPEGFPAHRICTTLDEAKDLIEAGAI